MDPDKDIDWIARIEDQFHRMAIVQGLAYGLVLLIVLISESFPRTDQQATFFGDAILVCVVFMAVGALSHVLDARECLGTAGRQGGVEAFLYLEVLDASFSFDGVIGVIAITQNLFLIAIGLGIGAMYVRTMTIMLMEKRVLSQFRFLEHGAFHSILALSVVMFFQSLVHVPEVVTGFAGAGIIAMSFAASIRFNRRYT